MLLTQCLRKHILNDYLIQLVYFKGYSKKYKERGSEIQDGEKQNSPFSSPITVGVWHSGPSRILGNFAVARGQRTWTWTHQSPSVLVVGHVSQALGPKLVSFLVWLVQARTEQDPLTIAWTPQQIRETKFEVKSSEFEGNCLSELQVNSQVSAVVLWQPITECNEQLFLNRRYSSWQLGNEIQLVG